MLKGKRILTNRRQFLGASTIGTGVVLATSGTSPAAGPDQAHILTEHGFWDYTAPGTGGMEGFQKVDYLSLLNDMSRSGMNSLMIYVKWLTTGYRSRLPFQDQLPGNPVIESDNLLLTQVIEEARKRKIKVWLGGAVTYFEAAKFGSEPFRIFDTLSGHKLPIRVGVYDTDTPGLLERAVAIYEELVELFPGVSGLCVELEAAGMEAPRRIGLYNRWAREHGRPEFSELGHPLDPRTFDVPAWRDYATYSRLKVLQAVETAVRSKGFRGELAMICETGSTEYAIGQEVNLVEFHRQFPAWSAITYEYDKWNHRNAMMDVCIDQPRGLGLRVLYLPRGIMTWGKTWPLPITLERSWQLDVEDIERYRPNAVWWFGCGTVNEGAHISLARLRTAGYADGVTARRSLLKIASKVRVG